MSIRKAFLAGLLLGTAVSSALAYDGDLKRGRMYYRQVCTACHQAGNKTIAPNEKTKAEWAAYIKADKHDRTGKSNASVKYFTTKAYRESIKASNKVAEKLLNVPDQEIYADIQAWVQYSAKDSDNPSGCN
ncbi:MAG TPA: hypothetical protein PKD29_10290 [Rhodocyclaceae bacterium]|nr:hypothetical protein [Rhodocyclaceae bacterium]